MLLAGSARADGDTSAEDRSVTFQVYKDTAEKYARLQDWSRCVEFCRKALQRFPDDPAATFLLGYAHHRQENDEKAEQAFRKVLARDADHTGARLWLGILLLRKQDPKAAYECFDALRGVADTEPRVLYGLASAHDAMHEKDPSPQNKNSALTYYRLYLSKARRSPGKGSEYVRKAQDRITELEYGDAGRTYNQALTAFEEGRFEDCRSLVARLLQKEPGFQKAHYLKGRLHATPGSGVFDPDYSEAIEEFGKALDEPEARWTLGWIFRLLGKDTQARENLLVAVEMDPQNQKAWNLLGALYREEGERAKAVEAYRRSVEVTDLGPEGREAKDRLAVLQGDVLKPAPGPGRDLEEEEAIEAQGLVADPVLHTRLQGILERLVERNRLLFRTDRDDLRIVDDQNLQAYSLRNGRIYVNIGLVRDVLERYPDSADDVLAFILAHELAHVERGHGFVAYWRTEDPGPSGAWPVGRRTILPERRRQEEFEADYLGTRYACAAGYDPGAAMAFLQGMIEGGDYLEDGAAVLQERCQRVRNCVGDLRSYYHLFEEASARLENDENAEAERLFLQFLAVFPEDPAARNNLDVALHKQSLACCHVSRWWKVSDIEPLRWKALRETRRRGTEGKTPAWCAEKAARAVEELERLLRCYPDDEAALTNLGNLYLDLGRLQEARKALQKAVARAPDYVHARNSYGVLLCKSGEFPRGIKEFEAAIRLDEDYLAPRFNLGEAYFRLGSYRAAVDCWERFLARDAGGTGWTARARHHSEDARRLLRKAAAEEASPSRATAH